MDALKVKYEQNRAEVLKSLDVSKDLLEVMTRHGLVDIADCVKYQGIHDVKKKNSSLMKTMVERRTERAYPLFIQSLRQAGQDSVANLLTDIGEETRILTHLQSELEHEIGAISDYLKQEERRSGIAPSGTEEDSPEPHPPPPAPTSDREVWVGVQSSLKRARGQFDRCRAVIDKLHKDCQDLASANGDMVAQIRNCYSRVRKMLKPGQPSSHTESVPKSTQAMFHTLIDDVEKLLNRKSRAQQEENEGRTTAMRMLRHLRDWIQERSSILDTLHATSSPSSSSSTPRLNRLPLLTSRRGTAGSGGGSQLHLHHHTPPPGPRHSSSRQHSVSPPRSQDTSVAGGGRGISPVTYLGELGGGQGQGQGQEAEHVRTVETHAIATVLEGLHLLEQQVRNYVHMEILLTDKFRVEMRYRHLRKRSHGFTHTGLADAQKAIERLQTGRHVTPNTTLTEREGLGVGGGGGGNDVYTMTKLRAVLDSMCEEYDSCVVYLTRVSKSLPLNKGQDVDGFLAQTDPHKDSKKKKNQKTDKDLLNRIHASNNSSPSSPSRSKDKSPSVFSGLFSRGKKDATTSSSSTGRTNNLPTVFTPSSNHSHSNGHDTAAADASLLSQLKMLVANYELVKVKYNRLEDRYRREYDHRRRAFDATLRERDEDITSLEIRLKELEAEKEKYRSLYDKMKVAYSKKR